MRVNAINTNCSAFKVNQAKLQTKPSQVLLDEPVKTDEVCFRGRGVKGAIIGGLAGALFGPVGVAVGALLGAGVATADGEGTTKEYGEPPNPDDWPYYP